MANIVFHAAHTRGKADLGWLKAAYSFSFAGWQNRERVQFGALRVLNDDIIGTNVGFGEHPHDNMEIVSIVLEGALSHKDSMGNIASIKANEVQVMSAGSGLQHSEFNHSKTDAINSLQIWIFPKERNITPLYEQKLFDPAARQQAWQTLVAPNTTEGDALKINQDAWIYRTTMQAGTTMAHPMKAKGNGVYAFLLRGKISSEGHILNTRDALGIWDTAEVVFSALEPSDLLLIEVPMEF